MIYYSVEKYLSKYTDTLITINTEDYKLAKKKFSKRCKDIEYVPGVGIDTSKFDFIMTKKERIKLRKSLGLKESDFVLIFPARLDKNKNQIFLINCMEQLIKKHNNIYLLLPGKDELNGLYQKEVNEKKLNNNIHFLGSRNDIPKLLKISDVSVSSSLREGLPVNVLEAFAVGKPVIALNCRGMDNIIINNFNGYLININEKNSLNSFVDKVEILYNNKKTLNNISNNISDKSIKQFSIDNVVKIMSDIYFEK